MKVADHLLGQVFGFEHRLWVFSGGRGIHCWVADSSVRSLGNEARVAVAEFMHLYQGTREGSKAHGKVDINAVQHPTLSKNSEVFKICEKYFVDVYIEGMGLLDTPEKWEKLLVLIDDGVAKKGLAAKLESWKELKNATEKWENVVQFLTNAKNFSRTWVPPVVQAIVYTFIYPRLDVNVSKGLNHLLKAPFCIHPRTGYVCVPLKIDQDVDTTPFYPEDNCPNIKGLIEDSDPDTIIQMKERLQLFKDFVQELTQEQSRERRNQNDNMEF
jgi:predicted DNA primase small subunit